MIKLQRTAETLIINLAHSWDDQASTNQLLMTQLNGPSSIHITVELQEPRRTA